MPTGTKAPASTKKAGAAKKGGGRKAPAAKKTPAGTGNTNLDNLLKLIRSNGKEGTTVKDLAAQAGVTQDTVRKGVKALEEAGKVKREGTTILSVSGRTGRRSDDVVERDNAILANIKAAGREGLALADVAESVSCTSQLAYESVWRLRAAEKIHREGSTRNAKWVFGKS